jgi:hypothetical protein
MLFGEMLLELLGCSPIHIIPSDSSEVSASIGFDDYEIARLHCQACALLDVEHIRSVTLEQDNM